MGRQARGIKIGIEDLFVCLSDKDKVDILAELYFSMEDKLKDAFLERTDNA